MPRIIPSFLVLGALLLIATLAGCGGFGLAYENRLSGKYELVAVDELEQMDVCEMMPSGNLSEVIPETVFAVGWDQHFIIAEQHPNDARHQIDKSVTKFYILRVADGVLTGPLDESAFGVERVKLEVPEGLNFTLVLDSLK